MPYTLHGMPLSASDQHAVEQLDQAIAGYLGSRGDVTERLQSAAERDPRLLMARCMAGYLGKLAGDTANAEKAAAVHGALAALAAEGEASAWERGHIEALGRWVAGDLETTAARLEAVLDRFPTDVLALRMLHYLYFYRGDPQRMRDSVARRFHRFPDDHPYRPYVMGMLAFGLEEAGSYPAAERFARAAVGENPADLWAAHAMAHVLEMQGRWQEGVIWIRGLRSHWEGANSFRYHLDWHQALFHLGAGEPEAALGVYDELLAPSVAEDFYLNMCNAASLLLRLRASGCAVGNRWQALTEVASRHVADTELVFASLHYLMPLLVAEDAAAESLLGTLGRWARSATTQGQVAAAAGQDAARFLVAAIRGDAAAALELFGDLRYRLPLIGGSHAQRDLFHILARDLAERAGYLDWVQDFDAERALARD